MVFTVFLLTQCRYLLHKTKLMKKNKELKELNGNKKLIRDSIELLKTHFGNNFGNYA